MGKKLKYLPSPGRSGEDIGMASSDLLLYFLSIYLFNILHPPQFPSGLFPEDLVCTHDSILPES